MSEETREARIEGESVRRIYESTQQLIYVSDRKVSALLLINAVLISLSATWNLEEYSGSIRAVILIAVVCAAVSTIFYLLAIIPRTSEQAPKSILHYKGILASSRDQYLSKMREISGEDLVKDYLETIYALSSIQMQKNRYL